MNTADGSFILQTYYKNNIGIYLEDGNYKLVKFGSKTTISESLGENNKFMRIQYFEKTHK